MMQKNVIGVSSLFGATLLLAAAAATGGPVAKPQVCWLETSAGDIDAAMGGAGLIGTKVWHSTISSVLVREPKGDVLIDTGFGPDAEAEMNELPPAGRDFGMMVVSGAKNRRPILDVLASVNERVARVIITHAHYDHLGGATQLTAPIYVARAEADWMAAQAAHPTITPSSLVAAVKPRLRMLAYASGPFMSFEKSDDIYGDGSNGTGLCLLSKRMEGSHFRWPRIEDGVMRLSAAQLSALVEGLDWARVAPREAERPRAAQ